MQTFNAYVHDACGRCAHHLSAFEAAGLRLAHMLEIEPVEAFGFLGRFGTEADIAAAAATLTMRVPA